MPLSSRVHAAACGLVLNVDGTAESFVMAGGGDEDTNPSQYFTTSFIYDVALGGMPTDAGFNLQNRLAYPAVATYGRSFVVFGGMEQPQDRQTSAIYRWNVATNELDRLPVNLTAPRSFGGAVRVEQDKFCTPREKEAIVFSSPLSSALLSIVYKTLLRYLTPMYIRGIFLC